MLITVSDLKNMVGPYDRVYHRNMLIDDNIISIFFWMLLGRDVSPVAPIGTDSAIYDLRQGEWDCDVQRGFWDGGSESDRRSLWPS